MRFFFLVLIYFNLSLPAYAETTTVILNPLPGHTENGTVVVTSQQQPHQFEWDLKGLNPSQHFYGVLLYENGDCSNYSSQVKPYLIDADKYVSTATGAHTTYFNITAWNASTSQKGKHAWAQTQVFIFSVKKKIFVLVEIVDFAKNLMGAAVACGVAP